MSDHADTIRRALFEYGADGKDSAFAALAALAARCDALENALREIAEGFEQTRIRAHDAILIARAALTATDTTRDLCPCGHSSAKHPATPTVAGDYSTACQVPGCQCRDWDGPEIVDAPAGERQET
jgi:hypothetical protein